MVVKALFIFACGQSSLSVFFVTAHTNFKENSYKYWQYASGLRKVRLRGVLLHAHYVSPPKLQNLFFVPSAAPASRCFPGKLYCCFFTICVHCFSSLPQDYYESSLGRGGPGRSAALPFYLTPPKR